MPLAAEDLPFWVGLVALTALVIYARGRLRDLSPGDRAMVIASGILGLAAATAARNVPFFAVVAAPTFSRLWPTSRTGRRRAPKPASAVAIALGAGACLLGALIVAAAWRSGDPRLGWQPLSKGTIDAVRRCPDPIFNQMEDGGPLAWFLPERRILVDSRMSPEAYPLRLLRQSREVDLGGDYRELFREYQIACAIVTTGSTLANRLSGDESFEMIYSDASRTVFARTGES
jgi:hypothetical protein